MISLDRVGDFTLSWGESLRWDDRRQRLYFVDCATQTFHWLDDAEPPLHSMKLPTMPAGLVLAESGSLVACLDDGLHVVDPDAGTSELLSAYPEGMHGRANDANADGAGNLITGTLNLVPAPGATWWFSVAEGWRLLDADIGNTNGPVVLDIEGQSTLVLADTPARVVYAYPYDGKSGRSASDASLATTPPSTAHLTAPRPTPRVECGDASSVVAGSPASQQTGSIVWWKRRWRIPAT